MSQAASQAQSTSAINSPGGSNNINSPGIWIAAIVAVVIVAVIWLKNRK